MDIDEPTLNGQIDRALKTWPFIPDQEKSHGLPIGLLLAVGARETNLTNEVGDGGHGHGVWQLDNRSHEIPVGFDGDVKAQAIKAAEMLAGLIADFGELGPALAAYNTGSGNVSKRLALGLSPDLDTANGDYSADVLERLDVVQHTLKVTSSHAATTTTTTALGEDDDDMATVVQATDGDQALYLFWSGKCVKMVHDELVNMAAVLGIPAAPTVHKTTAQVELAAACLSRPNGKR